MIPISDNVPSRSTPFVNVGLIVACVLVFVKQAMVPSFTDEWAFRPAFLLSAELFRVGPTHALLAMLASVFMHAGLMHIGGNMLFLWVFGDNVEDRMGHVKYLVFYLGCGIVATLAHSAASVLGLWSNPHSLEMPIVGASGAIAGVLGAYLVLCPGASVRTVVLFFIITIVEIPAAFFLVIWFVMQLFSGVGTLAGGTGGVAYWAHIGGFATGYIVAKGMTAGRRAKVRSLSDEG